MNGGHDTSANIIFWEMHTRPRGTRKSVDEKMTGQKVVLTCFATTSPFITSGTNLFSTGLRSPSGSSTQSPPPHLFSLSLAFLSSYNCIASCYSQINQKHILDWGLRCIQ